MHVCGLVRVYRYNIVDMLFFSFPFLSTPLLECSRKLEMILFGHVKCLAHSPPDSMTTD